MPRARAKGSIAGNHGRVEHFGENEVHRIVHRDVVTQFPSTDEEINVAVSNQAKQPQVDDGRCGSGV